MRTKDLVKIFADRDILKQKIDENKHKLNKNIHSMIKNCDSTSLQNKLLAKN